MFFLAISGFLGRSRSDSSTTWRRLRLVYFIGPCLLLVTFLLAKNWAQMLACLHGPYTNSNSFHSFVPHVPIVTYSKTQDLRVEFVEELLTMTQWKDYRYADGRRWRSSSTKTQRKTRRTMMARMARIQTGPGRICHYPRTSPCCLPTVKYVTRIVCFLAGMFKLITCSRIFSAVLVHPTRTPTLQSSTEKQANTNVPTSIPTIHPQ